MAKSKAKIKPIQTTFNLLRRHLSLWLMAGAVAVMVSMLLGLIAQPGAPITGQGLWLIICFSAFIWLADQLKRSKKPPIVSAVFYQGSAAFVKQFLIITFWVICLIPFAGGAVLFAEATSTFFDPSGTEVALLSLIWLMAATASFYLILRSVYAPVLALSETPATAIATSWRLSKKRVRFIAARVIGWLLLLMLPLVLIQYVTIGGLVTNNLLVSSLNVLADIIIYVVMLPVMAVLIYQLYLYETRTRTHPKTKK